MIFWEFKNWFSVMILNKKKKRGGTIYLKEKKHVIQKELAFLLTPFTLSFPGI